MLKTQSKMFLFYSYMKIYIIHDLFIQFYMYVKFSIFMRVPRGRRGFPTDMVYTIVDMIVLSIRILYIIAARSYY